MMSVVFLIAATFAAGADAATWPEGIRLILEETRPLDRPRGKRLPLYLWPAHAPAGLDDATAEAIIRALDERGVGLIASWHPGQREQTLETGLRIARIQTRLGLHVNVSANACLYSFFNGDKRTAHVDDEGKTFWDDSFGNKPMGCPFAIDFRKPEIRERVTFFADAYKKAGVNLDFVYADWEIDGPIEWNRAHAASKRCRRCRKEIENIEDFTAFQKALREIRNELQRDCYARPILDRYPEALVGNYAVYPHNGLRYWYDYFEYYVEGQPFVPDRRAKYRKWYHEFAGTGYTFAMPVVYTWRPIFGWYDFDDPDYRWFYNMLLTASNAGKHTPPDVPIISFVHWHTVKVGEDDASVKQFSERAYQELLWHMLLRGVDTFFMWSPADEAAKEIRLVHPVYAEAQRYGAFLEKGMPIHFDVPLKPAPVVSGLRLGNKVLVRRTEFGDDSAPVRITVDSKSLTVRSSPGECRILTLE